MMIDEVTGDRIPGDQSWTICPLFRVTAPFVDTWSLYVASRLPPGLIASERSETTHREAATSVLPHLAWGAVTQTHGFFIRGSVSGGESCVLRRSSIKRPFCLLLRSAHEQSAKWRRLVDVH